MTGLSHAEEHKLALLSTERKHELLGKHKAFWRRESGSKAIIGYAPQARVFPLQNLNLPLSGRLLPEHITPELVEQDAQYRPDYQTRSDLFPTKIPLEPLAWSEAYCGAQVSISQESMTVWSREASKVPETIEDIDALVERDWLTKLVEATKANAEYAGDDILVSETLLRGPADVLASLVGVESLCMDVADRPAKVAEMAEHLAGHVIELYEAQLSVIPRFHGGTVNRYGIWGEGRNIVTQADVANLISPGCFRECFVPAYRRLAQAFDSVTIHFHSCASQHVDALLEMDELTSIEWAMDPTGPTLAEMIPILARVLERKPTIVMNVRSDQEQETLLKNLPQEGLCIIRRTAK